MSAFNRIHWAQYLAVLLSCIVWLYPFGHVPAVNVHVYVVTGVCFGSLCLLMSRVHREKQDWLQDLATGWALAAGLNACVVFVQFLRIQLSDWPLELNQWIIQYPKNVAGFDEAQIVGQIRQRNQVATFMVIGLICGLTLYGQSLKLSLSVWQRCSRAAVTAAMVVLCTSALLITSSRIGLLECVVAWLAGLLFRRTLRWPWWSLVLIPCTYVGAQYLLPWVYAWSQGSSETLVMGAIRRIGGNDGCTSRVILWRNVLELISQKPWTGWGWGELPYAHYMARYSWGPVGDPGERTCGFLLTNAHNLFLQVAVELGIPALLILIGALAWAVGKRRPWALQEPLLMMAWGIILMIMIHSMVEYPLWYGQFIFTMVFCVYSVWPDGGKPRLTQELQQRQSAGVLLGMALILFSNFLQFDYSRARQPFLPPEQRSTWFGNDMMKSARQTVLFQSYVEFAILSTQTVTPHNAQEQLDRAQRLLHHLPDATVVAQLVEAAQTLGKQDLAEFHTRQMAYVYPEQYAKWHQAREERKKRTGSTALVSELSDPASTTTAVSESSP